MPTWARRGNRYDRNHFGSHLLHFPVALARVSGKIGCWVDARTMLIKWCELVRVRGGSNNNRRLLLALKNILSDLQVTHESTTGSNALTGWPNQNLKDLPCICLHRYVPVQDSVTHMTGPYCAHGCKFVQGANAKSYPWTSPIVVASTLWLSANSAEYLVWCKPGWVKNS